MRFRYLRDPLFLLCVVLYFANRPLLKQVLTSVFLDSCLNDLVRIPFWVPIMLYALRRLGLRRNDAMPGACEILIPLLVWSVVFELILPCLEPFRHIAVSDHVDVLFYALGALLAAVFWKTWYGDSIVSCRPAR
jgi:hypothetical protein